jgi:hypothetical protein
VDHLALGLASCCTVGFQCWVPARTLSHQFGIQNHCQRHLVIKTWWWCLLMIGVSAGTAVWSIFWLWGCTDDLLEVLGQLLRFSGVFQHSVPAWTLPNQFSLQHHSQRHLEPRNWYYCLFVIALWDGIWACSISWPWGHFKVFLVFSSTGCLPGQHCQTNFHSSTIHRDIWNLGICWIVCLW